MPTHVYSEHYKLVAIEEIEEIEAISLQFFIELVQFCAKKNVLWKASEKLLISDHFSIWRQCQLHRIGSESFELRLTTRKTNQKNWPYSKSFFHRSYLWNKHFYWNFQFSNKCWFFSSLFPIWYVKIRSFSLTFSINLKAVIKKYYYKISFLNMNNQVFVI